MFQFCFSFISIVPIILYGGHLRSAERNLLHVPRRRLNTYSRRRASAIAGSSSWNSLPDPVRNPNATEAAFIYVRTVLMNLAHALYTNLGIKESA